MAIVFAARSDNASFNARYTVGLNGGKTFFSAGGSITSGADGTAIGGNAWTIGSTGTKSLVFPGRLNTPAGRVISVLVRKAPAYTGAPSASYGIIGLNSNVGRGPELQVEHLVTSGNIQIMARNEAFATAINNLSPAAWSPTSGTWYDLFFTWDGTTGAGSFNFFVDGSSIGTVTPGAAFSASWNNQMFQEIVLGVSDTFAGAGAAWGKLNEIVIWDTAIDPTSVVLTSGTGSLNGASRTAFVDVAAFVGLPSVGAATGGLIQGV